METDRELARQKGDVRYLPKVKCKHGHLASRYVKGNACVTCAKIGKSKFHDKREETETEYIRKYRNDNPKRCWSYESYYRCRHRAKKKGQIFNLTSSKDILDLAQDVCPILKIPLQYETGHGYTDNSPTVDRIHCDKGYVRGNLHVISRKANIMKSNGTLHDIERLYLWAKANMTE